MKARPGNADQWKKPNERGAGRITNEIQEQHSEACPSASGFRDIDGRPRLAVPPKVLYSLSRSVLNSVSELRDSWYLVRKSWAGRVTLGSYIPPYKTPASHPELGTPLPKGCFPKRAPSAAPEWSDRQILSLACSLSPRTLHLWIPDYPQTLFCPHALLTQLEVNWRGLMSLLSLKAFVGFSILGVHFTGFRQEIRTFHQLTLSIRCGGKKSQIQ